MIHHSSFIIHHSSLKQHLPFTVQYAPMIGSRPLPLARLRFPRFDRGVATLLSVFVALLPLFTAHFYATDSVQYYAYLRSLTFDGDLDFTNEYARFHTMYPASGIDRALLPRIDGDSGELVNVDPRTKLPINVAPVGSAILWAPAFALAHGGVLLARAFGAGVEADGYSRPYIIAICFASALYGLGGLLLSYAVARRYAGVWAALAAALVCWLASPLVFYMYVSPGWSHTGSLFATALFVWYWLRTRSTRTGAQWALLGVLGGLMTLTREQLGLFLLLPAIEALGSYWRPLRERRWRQVYRLLLLHVVFLLVFAVSLAPQLAAYQVLNGRMAPSTEVLDKVGFDPQDPYAHGVPGSAHFWDTLVDARPSPETGRPFAHGALVWTPVWALALLGLALLGRRDPMLLVSLGLAFAAQVWINGSFGTTWHLSGSFGFRRLIEATPIFVLGLALLAERARLPRPAVALLGVLLVTWNVGLIYQWAVLGASDRTLRAGLVWDGMLERQVGLPARLGGDVWRLLWDRASFFQNDPGSWSPPAPGEASAATRRA